VGKIAKKQSEKARFC